MNNFFNGFSWFDWIILLLPFIYIGVFIFVILPIFAVEILYLQIVSIVLLIAFPVASFMWFKSGNKGK